MPCVENAAIYKSQETPLKMLPFTNHRKHHGTLVMKMHHRKGVYSDDGWTTCSEPSLCQHKNKVIAMNSLRCTCIVTRNNNIMIISFSCDFYPVFLTLVCNQPSLPSWTSSFPCSSRYQTLLFSSDCCCMENIKTSRHTTQMSEFLLQSILIGQRLYWYVHAETVVTSCTVRSPDC
jgi:hypothetical protein